MFIEVRMHCLPLGYIMARNPLCSVGHSFVSSWLKYIVMLLKRVMRKLGCGVELKWWRVRTLAEEYVNVVLSEWPWIREKVMPGKVAGQVFLLQLHRQKTSWTPMGWLNRIWVISTYYCCAGCRCPSVATTFVMDVVTFCQAYMCVEKVWSFIEPNVSWWETREKLKATPHNDSVLS